MKDNNDIAIWNWYRGLNGIGIGRGGGGAYKNRIVNLFGSHLIGFWSLDDSDATALDLSPEVNNAAYAGTYTQGHDGIFSTKCTDFLGTGSLNMYSAGLASDVNLTEGYMSVWIKTPLVNTWDTPAKYIGSLSTDEAGNRSYSLVMADRKLAYYYIAGGTVLSVIIDVPYGDRWFNYGVRWSKSEDAINIYLNGVKVRTAVGGLGTWVGGLTATRANILALHGGVFQFNAKAAYGVLLNYAPSDDDILKTVEPRGIVLFEGDSRSNIKGWSGIALNYTDTDSVYGFSKYGYANYATSGATLGTIVARAATVNTRQINGINTLIVWIGVNDAGAGATAIYNAIKGYCQNARAAGWDKIILCSEIDSQANMTWHTTVWPALNALIYADHSFVDALADLGARTELQDATNLTYYTADKIHLTAAGYDVVAEVVGNAIKTII